ncbi:MAG: Na/Pi cotransporter family protein [Eubacterium sp.]|nr:Na/Pi cotransporter family protein [Eubacterium sp.]
MNIFSVISLLGGIALFLYGMSFMGDQLEKLSGGKLEQILEKMTDKTYKGVLLGAVVTAVIQSSSAVTVMVVGFVNSGIMQLSRAIGVIMGANIGTTVTGWILSLTQINGESFIISLLKPSSFTPVLALISVFVLMFSKKEKQKNIGGIAMGFSILMIGMTLMSDSMSGLADDENFTSLMLTFSNPVVGIIAGTLLAAVVQSSSASVGILQALALSGGVSFGAAIPIILGQNIGSCVPVLISSVGTGKNAKRAAFIYLYFNVIGVVVTGALFYGVDYFVNFAFMENPISSVQIAILNTAFKVFSTVILLPFTKQLEALAVKTIRGKYEEKEEKKKQPLIDDRLLISPAFAVEKCREVTIQMADMVEETALCALSVVKNYTDEKAEMITKNEKKSDKYEDLLETYLIKISKMDISDVDSKNIFMLHHAVDNFEQISDYSEDILTARQTMNKKKVNLSDQAKYELSVMIAAATKIVSVTNKAFKLNDLELARKVQPLEDVIDKLKKELKYRHMQRIDEGECTVEQGLPYLDIVSAIEHIADHCCDIALSMIEIKSGDYNVHSYVRDVKENDENFIEKLDSYLEKYSLN